MTTWKVLLPIAFMLIFLDQHVQDCIYLISSVLWKRTDHVDYVKEKLRKGSKRLSNLEGDIKPFKISTQVKCF